MLETFFSSLVGIFEPVTFLTMLVGIAIGFVVGILPGLGGSVSLALMLPFTFYMEPVQAFAFLLGMYVVTATTGDITSVLFGVPGEATSAATVLDGYPLTRQGQAGRALGGALVSSAMGAILGAFVLALSVPIMRPLVLALGPPEFFMLTILGLSFVIALSGRDIVKGLVMAALGFLVSMVGLDPQAGVPRYAFDSLYLWDGINIVALVVGLFGGAELLQLMLSKTSISQRMSADPYAGLGQGVREVFKHWTVVVRSSLIGIGIGIIPGMGGSVSQFIAYGSAQQASKEPEKFGKGSMEGVVAAGANNNAKDSGSLIPTIAFGIPGSVSMAVLLGAFIISGLNPGPEMLNENLDVTFSMVWIMVIANLIAVVVSLLLLRQLVKLSFLKGTWLVPFLLILLSIGAFTANYAWQDVVVMLVAAALGVVCIHWDWPRVPFLLAVVLGATAERYLFLSYSLDGWTWLREPVVLILAVLIVLVIALPYVRRSRDRRRDEAARVAENTEVSR
ncbi:tripartite tricarboxylate transporter permease [Modestobacter muralis]|uniref:Tripartite tricarboxylate transporter permease n=1 Tax=Modestobacter muralis TaxID=1608614 RepID=A0A6P0H8T1_9ACTN|nr:tripartite tricarboxylate transporter permease [Modestobacter muralis]NEK95244.1 tripartite tricarboxylate transporter permease [Modestobacter muralis]NEN52132.1 tripartite tricarboxylate transporter permease [Modestobacter muralis]